MKSADGYAMAALLVAIAVMGILASVLLPLWSQSLIREKEAELVFRGEQYVRAIELYQRQYIGAYPPDLDALIDGRFLRRLYSDPMTKGGKGKFRLIYQSELEEFLSTPKRNNLAGDQSSLVLSGQKERNTEQSSSDRLTGGVRGEGGVAGVVSRSTEKSIRIYHGQRRYSDWSFVYSTENAETSSGLNEDRNSDTERFRDY